MISSRLLAAPLAALFLTAPLPAADWMTDFDAAQKKAVEEKKDLLINFTGSDWCGWCIRLKEEVFSQGAFKKMAPSEFVLVELDFPRKPENVEKQPEAVREQNEALAEKYGVQGFPTIILADAQGRPYAQTGYEEGGVDNYLVHLAQLRGVRKKRDEAMARASQLEGMDRAKAVAEALTPIERDLRIGFYQAEIDAIIEADKEDTLGYAKMREEKEQQAAFGEKIEELAPAVEEHLQKQDFKAAMAAVDAWIEKNAFKGAMLQQAMAVKIGFLYQMGDHQGALDLVDEIIAVDPDTTLADDMKESLRPQIEEAVKQAKAEASGEEEAE